MQHHDSDVRVATVALRELSVGWERYRTILAHQLKMGSSELAALGHLYADGRLSPSELGHRLRLTSGSITALVDRLETAGYVTRDAHPGDRRRLLVESTPAGKRAVQWVYERMDHAVAMALSTVPNSSVEQITAFLDAVTQELSLREISQASA